MVPTAGCGRRQRVAILYLSLRNEQTPRRSVFTPHHPRESFSLSDSGLWMKSALTGQAECLGKQHF